MNISHSIMRISVKSLSVSRTSFLRLSFKHGPFNCNQLSIRNLQAQAPLAITPFLVSRNYHLDSAATIGTGIIEGQETGTKYNVEVKSSSTTGNEVLSSGEADTTGAIETVTNGIGLEHLPPVNVGMFGSIFSEAAPVLFTRDLLYQLHDFPGMDWAKTIVLTTFGIRFLFCLPLGIAQQKSMAKLENLQPQFKQLATDLARETSIAIKVYNWSQATAKRQYKKSFKKHWRSLVEEHNCHPMRSLFLVWLQVPFWICFSSAIRNVVFALPEPRTSEMLLHWMEMAGESPFWIESLATVDPFVLPGIFLVANLINIQINSARKLTVPQTKLQIALPWVFRVGVFGIATVAAFTPSAVTMYWATSSVCALIQNLLLKTKPVRKFFGIPSTPTQP